MGDIFTTVAVITSVAIRIEVRARYAGTIEIVATESRPATLADADTFLAFHGFRRVRDWDLDANGGLEARARMVVNQFNGTVAARLDQAVGTTHGEFEYANACKVENGDLISDSELSEVYVVAGSSTDGDATKIHMVGEGKTWEDRYTGHFIPQQLVKVARKR